jgi:hypothetical protein
VGGDKPGHRGRGGHGGGGLQARRATLRRSAHEGLTDGESHDHGLLVHHLTVLPRSERVSFVSWIAFAAKNVAVDAVAREEPIARTGRMAVPVIMVDNEVVLGLDRGRLQRLLGI